MSLKIVRNDITKMNTDAVVNTANRNVTVGDGCDRAINKAAGFDKLLEARREIGPLDEGEVCITPGFDLPAKYIIHAVSPAYVADSEDVVSKLRACYKNSLEIARDSKLRSVAFPLIATGSFGFPREEGMRIAVDEINSFLLHDDLTVYLVVFDDHSTRLGKKFKSDLDSYIDSKYVDRKIEEEYCNATCDMAFDAIRQKDSAEIEAMPIEPMPTAPMAAAGSVQEEPVLKNSSVRRIGLPKPTFARHSETSKKGALARIWSTLSDEGKEEALEAGIEERMKHLSDTFSEYLLFLIQKKGLENAEVYKKAIVDKKVFSKIKNNPEYHPQKITALCLCVGAQLNLDETKDLLARAGYALSPCDKTDIIFSYFIENEIFDMIEIDIQLEEHGLPCIIA